MRSRRRDKGGWINEDGGPMLAAIAASVAIAVLAGIPASRALAFALGGRLAV